jgi:hypothetical protein
MEKTREELDAQLVVLTAQLLEAEKTTDEYRSQVALNKRQLEDVNKPELTEDQYAHLCDAINDALREFNFEDSGNYDIDFSLDYGNQIIADNITFNEMDELQMAIEQAIESVFKTTE